MSNMEVYPSEKKFIVAVEISANDLNEACEISELFNDRQTKAGNTGGLHWSESSMVRHVKAAKSRESRADQFAHSVKSVSTNRGHHYSAHPAVGVFVEKDMLTGKMSFTVTFDDGSEFKIDS